MSDRSEATPAGWGEQVGRPAGAEAEAAAAAGAGDRVLRAAASAPATAAPGDRPPRAAASAAATAAPGDWPPRAAAAPGNRALRVVAVDLGSRRIGVAVSDPTGTLASPHSVVDRSGDAAADHRRLAAIVAEVGAERVVVGLPLSLDGSAGTAALAAAAEADALAAVVGVPVETYDERLTTVTAQQALRAGGTRARRQRGVIDKAAAAVLLQAWLDRRSR